MARKRAHIATEGATSSASLVSSPKSNPNPITSPNASSKLHGAIATPNTIFIIEYGTTSFFFGYAPTATSFAPRAGQTSDPTNAGLPEIAIDGTPQCRQFLDPEHRTIPYGATTSLFSHC
jgi:hypothetical protein